MVNGDDDVGRWCNSHEEDSNAYVWSYAKRAVGTHVLRQKHWPGNAMMHPPDPSTFATSVAIRSVRHVLVMSCYGAALVVCGRLFLWFCAGSILGWLCFVVLCLRCSSVVLILCYACPSRVLAVHST